ncbi:MAG: hypothetical protein EOO09_16885, partial [Chitinophagaceae bacterium]
MPAKIPSRSRGLILQLAFIAASGWLGPASLHAQATLYPNEFPATAVRLLDGPFKKAATLNSKVLLEYDADRLLAGYRKEAGLDE